MRLAYYLRVKGLLSQLDILQPFMSQLQQEGTETGISMPFSGDQLTELLTSFSKQDVRVDAGKGVKGEKNRAHGYCDPATGIAYAMGKKKESSARVWIVPLQGDKLSEPVGLPPMAEEALSATTATPSDSTTTPPSSATSSPGIGRILVNSLPLPAYFGLQSERSVLLRPFSLTSTLGRYNVFVLVRGGGNSSQAQAAAVACARALANINNEGEDESSSEAINKKILSKGRFCLHSHYYLACSADLPVGEKRTCSEEIQEWWRGRRRANPKQGRAIRG